MPTDDNDTALGFEAALAEQIELFFAANGGWFATVEDVEEFFLALPDWVYLLPATEVHLHPNCFNGDDEERLFDLLVMTMVIDSRLHPVHQTQLIAHTADASIYPNSFDPINVDIDEDSAIGDSDTDIEWPDESLCGVADVGYTDTDSDTDTDYDDWGWPGTAATDEYVEIPPPSEKSRAKYTWPKPVEPRGFRDSQRNSASGSHGNRVDRRAASRRP